MRAVPERATSRDADRRLRVGVFASLIALCGAATVAVWWLTNAPARPPLPPRLEAKREVEPKPEAPAAQTERPAKRTALRVAVREAVAVSATAAAAVHDGRFIVSTGIAAGGEAAFYRAMLSRGGALVVERAEGKYELFDRGGNLEPLDAAGERLRGFAIQRPRQLGAAELRHVAGLAAAANGGTVFLVMPERFEAELLSAIERVLGGKLEDWSRATVAARVLPNGGVEFRLETARNAGTAVDLNVDRIAAVL